MESPAVYSLFFLKENAFFDEGTLVELEAASVSLASLDPTSDQPFNTVPPEHFETYGYRLPDRGDGIPGFVETDAVIPCPPFAENVPPGRCPVKITYTRVLDDADPAFDDNPNCLGIFGISLVENLHWQKIVVPLPRRFPEIRNVTLVDTLRKFEVDSYEKPAVEIVAGEAAYSLHIGHVGPGFYEMDMRLERGRHLRLRFIKFFPPEFTGRYEAIKHSAPSSKTPGRQSDSMPVNLYHSHSEDRPSYEFPIEMVNKALEFATEWGPNFRKPINERMLGVYPDLKDDEIARLKTIADDAENFILDLAERELRGEITEYDIVPMARERFAWIEETQLNRIKNIGMFWARK